MPRIAVEPGRAIVGPAAITVYEVGTVKPVRLDGGTERTYVSVDGGMSDNIRTALYDASYTVDARQPSRRARRRCWRASSASTARAATSSCATRWLPADIAPGDLLAVAATGAYCRSMASNYNYVPRPPVVAVRDGRRRCCVRRETEADLLRLDTGWQPDGHDRWLTRCGSRCSAAASSARRSCG